ncbi:MAG TPA: hypothetical protein PLF60_01505 [Bacillota bacterium]|nr:hypothetical protein [Bacillota bacterium]HOP70324.1 hypothetical protein [Bacillota bacterium]HQD86082.1 hypothetical protein [Bacillota bacterium]
MAVRVTSAKQGYWAQGSKGEHYCGENIGRLRLPGYGDTSNQQKDVHR